MEIKKRSLNNSNKAVENEPAAKRVKVGTYDCETTKTPNIFKIIGRNGGYLVRCNYGKIEKIMKKTGVKREMVEITLKVVPTYTEAKSLLNEVDTIRNQRKQNIGVPIKKIAEKITLDDAMAAFKKDRVYTELSENYQIHFNNYFNHISDFMGYKEPSKVTVTDIEDYFQYELEHGNLQKGGRKPEGSKSKKAGKSDRVGVSVNTLGKHKTALKKLWNYMIKSGGYGVTMNIPVLSEIPYVEIQIDNKTYRTKHIQPKQCPLSLEELNYTLNDCIQNEHDRSLAMLIAFGSIGGLRRGEIAALKVGRYYHDERMKTGEEMWTLNDFQCLREYYEKHNELILIDEAIQHNRTETLAFPKSNIIRMVAKPKCLDDIVEYAMEQRKQIYDNLGISIRSDENLYLPMINCIQQNQYSSAKISRKWMQYQERRNKRMEKAGLKPIPIIRYHDLRHTHASLLSEEISVKEISRNMGHIIPGEGQVNNTTTKVYIHDRVPNRANIIKYWDDNIKIDWDKAMRVDINAPGNRAHVNGSGHLVIQDEDKKKAMMLKKRFILTEEEEAELLCSEK